MSLLVLAQLIGVAVGLIALVGALFRAWRWSVRVANKVDKLDELLELARHELKPNSGTSMKDRINKTEHHVTRLSEDVRELKDLVQGFSLANAKEHASLWAVVREVQNGREENSHTS